MVYTNNPPHQLSQRLEPLNINESSALYEGQRCLYCYDAPCTEKCPVSIDVPGFIKRLAEGNLYGSGALLYKSNPMAAICGLVCPTDTLCEGACVLHGIGQRPIRIGALQFFVSSRHTIAEAEKMISWLSVSTSTSPGGGNDLSFWVLVSRPAHPKHAESVTKIIDRFMAKSSLIGLFDGSRCDSRE